MATATVLNVRLLLNTRILIRRLLSTRTNLIQIERKCYDCMHTPPDNVITEKDVIITNDAITRHFKCAVNGRKSIPGERSRQSRPYHPGFQAVAKLVKAQQDKLDNTRAAVDLSALFDADPD